MRDFGEREFLLFSGICSKKPLKSYNNKKEGCFINRNHLPKMRRQLRKNAPVFFAAALTIVISLVSGVLLVERRIAPLVEYIGMAKAEQAASAAVFNSINEYLNQTQITYDDLVYIDKDEKGKVTALKTNIVQINRLKAEITLRILGALESLQKTDIIIPIGDVINGELLLGRGPGLKIRITSVGTIDVEMVNDFSEAGINQTRHKIQMDITVHIGIILPGRHRVHEVKSGVSIAETVIVGDVPGSYTQVTNDPNSLIGKINDYGGK